MLAIGFRAGDAVRFAELTCQDPAANQSVGRKRTKKAALNKRSLPEAEAIAITFPGVKI